MMIFTAVIAALAPLVLCYDEAFDKIDVDKILGDEVVYQSYINCLLDKGPCEQEHSAEFRKLLPEVIATTCEKCTPIQKKNVKKVTKALSSRNPEQFKEFIQKYDPSHEYEKSFTAFVLSSD